MKFKTSFRNVNNSIDFYHSSFVALIDTKQQIRGFYDILNNEEVENLEDDIIVLLKNI
jgi:cytochrome oxidase Cu insertion factor (SCO1/SenC/PrrC family)